MIVRALAGTVDSTAPAIPSQALEFSEIFRTYAPFAWRLLRRLGGAEADAHDVIQ
jgi:DNA-directed RNA polymerase specialized sigma24 family protein